MTGDGTLNANSGAYAQAGGLPPPPPITSDMPPEVRTWIEAAVAALFGAANLGDPEDNAKAQQGHAEREAMATDAATRFPAGDEQQAMGMDQMAQQIPQMISGAAGAISGGLGGALQPFMQMPQQLAQTAQQLMQSGMGALKGGESGLDAAELTSDFDPLGADGGAGDLGAGGGSGGGGGGIGTTPMSMLGPPATPSSSTATAPTAGRVMAGPPAAAATTAYPPTAMGGMGGVPMLPPGMGPGAAGGKDDKADTKRVSVPSIKNGAPVQGRVTAPPIAPTVSKTTEEARLRATRRIVIPSDKTEKADENPDKRPDL